MKSIWLSTLVFLMFQFLNSDLIAQDKQIDKNYKDNVIQKITLLVKENYVLKQKRDTIAEQLKNKNINGNYDKVNDYENYADQLTSDLQSISGDKHFAVKYNPARVAEMRIEHNEDETGNEEQENIEKRRFESQRRDNFGFHKVEILKGNIGYLDLHSFREVSIAGKTAHGAMAFLANTDAIIIDLRKNHGGGASMYTLLSSYFFGKDPVHLGSIYNGLSDETQDFWTLSDIPGEKMPDIDLYILTSNKTFSAAEEFAYDLKHIKRAIIVGEPTGGGAHMVTRMEINDEFYILMPFAGAVNPVTKSNWEGVGVIPDIKVKSDDALKTAHILIINKLINKITDDEYKKELETLLEELKLK